MCSAVRAEQGQSAAPGGPPGLRTRRAGVILVYRRWHVKSAEAESGGTKVQPRLSLFVATRYCHFGRVQSDCDC